MKKYFVFSDVHSFYDELMKALEEKGFDINNQDHIIISCGDIADRGPKVLECLEFVNDLYDKGRAILVRGNHEDLLEDIFKKNYFEMCDDHNGTIDTCCALADEELDGLHCSNVKSIIKKARENELIKSYLSHLVNYAEIGENLFVHGWIPVTYADDECYSIVYDKDWRNADEFLWYEARWLNGMYQWHRGIRELGKTIYCGHWHASFGHARYHNDGVEFLRPLETMHFDEETGQYEPHVNHHTFKDDGIRALDSCCIESHIINVEVLEI